MQPPTSRESQIAHRARIRTLQWVCCLLSGLASLSFFFVPKVLRTAPTPLYRYIDALAPAWVVGLVLVWVVAVQVAGLLMTRREPPLNTDDSRRPTQAERRGAWMCVGGNASQIVVWGYLVCVYLQLLFERQAFLGSFLSVAPFAIAFYTSKWVLKEAFEWKNATLEREMENKPIDEALAILDRHCPAPRRSKVVTKTL